MNLPVYPNTVRQRQQCPYCGDKFCVFNGIEGNGDTKIAIYSCVSCMTPHARTFIEKMPSIYDMTNDETLGTIKAWAEEDKVEGKHVLALIAEIECLKGALEKYATTHGNNHALAQMTLYGRLLTPRELDDIQKGGE